MRTNIPKLLFICRNDFRQWLIENAETSEGVWLIFGKTKSVVSLSANDALEEALCFGWIDGQMNSIDATKYQKYFARRRPKSIWSERNKKIIDMLREKGMMSELGEMAIVNAKKNGTWSGVKRNEITDEQIEEFAQKLVNISPASENFNKMSHSIQITYIRRYLSFKSEESRQRDFQKIIDRLNNNLKPM